MAKIAIISDIHANLTALEAIMLDLRRLAPDQVLVLGDIVGRGPRAVEVLELVAGQNWQVVMGNHEEFWVQSGRGQLPEEWGDNWWKPTRLQIEHLEKRWFDWMEALPREYVVQIPGAPAVLAVHGSPRKINEGLYHHVPAEALIETLGQAPCPIIVGAHTHHPMNRRAGRYWVLNSGSVGAPFNEDPSAQYLLLIWRNGEWHAEFRRVAYDFQSELRYWHASGYWTSGVAAQIYAYELETASFHFWHYVRFCEVFELRYNRPDSFARYREEYPLYQQYCQERNLSSHDTANLRQYRAQIER